MPRTLPAVPVTLMGKSMSTESQTVCIVLLPHRRRFRSLNLWVLHSPDMRDVEIDGGEQPEPGRSRIDGCVGRETNQVCLPAVCECTEVGGRFQLVKKGATWKLRSRWVNACSVPNVGKHAVSGRAPMAFPWSQTYRNTASISSRSLAIASP
jgi:hypothetical protein